MKKLLTALIALSMVAAISATVSAVGQPCPANIDDCDGGCSHAPEEPCEDDCDLSCCGGEEPGCDECDEWTAEDGCECNSATLGDNNSDSGDTVVNNDVSNSPKDSNPAAGVALVIVPTLLAGIGIITARKRK